MSNKVFCASALLLLASQASAQLPLTVTYMKSSVPSFGAMFGFSVSASGDTVAVGAPLESPTPLGPGTRPVEYGGAAYIYVRSGSTWRFQARLSPPNPGDGAKFGYSICVSGNTVVIGAPGESSNARGVNGTATGIAGESGAAYVFVRAGETWTLQAYLKAHNTGARDAFGFSVGISGDTIVVGAPNEASSSRGTNGADNNEHEGAGAAYVYQRSGAVWAFRNFLKSSNNSLIGSSSFGSAVAVDGGRLVVGAPIESSRADGSVNPDDPAILGSGAAHVFETNTDGVWFERALLKASPIRPGASFGWSVGIAGARIVVGAPLEAGSTAGGPIRSSGAAYVFDAAAGSQYAQTGVLKGAAPAAEDYFGRSVAVSPAAVLVGADREDSRTQPGDMGSIDSGSASLFIPSGSGWMLSRTFKAPNAAPGDWLGKSVALSGNVAVAGAPTEDGSAALVNGDPQAKNLGDAGAVYVFESGNGDQPVYLSATPVPATMSIIGSGCSITGARQTPVSFMWRAGQPCRIQAMSSFQQASGVRYQFVQWADGSRQLERDLANTPLSALTATFERHVRLILSVTPDGSGTVTPSSGQYYKEGSVVTVSATPIACKALAGWTGGTVTASAIKLTEPAELRANFGPVTAPSTVVGPPAVQNPQNRYRYEITAVNPLPFTADVTIMFETLGVGAAVLDPTNPTGRTTSCTGTPNRAYYTYRNVSPGAKAALTLLIRASSLANSRISASAIAGPGTR